MTFGELQEARMLNSIKAQAVRMQHPVVGTLTRIDDVRGYDSKDARTWLRQYVDESGALYVLDWYNVLLYVELA